MGKTYDPSGRLAIHDLLSIGPLLQEFIRGIEVGGDGPFTEPQRDILDCGGTLKPVQVWNTKTSPRVPCRVQSEDDCLLQMWVR